MHITNQGNSPSDGGIYKPFNPLYSIEDDHHARLGFGGYNKSSFVSYYAYAYDENHDPLANFHQYIDACFEIKGDEDYARIQHGYSFKNKYEYVLGAGGGMPDGQVKRYNWFKVEQILGENIKGNCKREHKHYYQFVLYNPDDISHIYEAVACNKDFNPLADIESCVDANFGGLADDIA